MRITVIESTAARPEIREAVRAAFEDLPHEVDYTTDGGTNIFERLLDRDAYVLLDSHVGGSSGSHFGWAIRGLPGLIVVDAGASMYDLEVARENPVCHVVERAASPSPMAISQFFRDGFAAMKRDPSIYTPRAIRSKITPGVRDSVFVSYSHRDAEHLDRLLVHLEPLTRTGVIKLWSDQQIRPGAHWREEIATAIGNAAIAILLVSPDFLASEFISTDELPPLLRAAEGEGARILPVILRPCRFTRDPELSSFQAFNRAAPVGLLSEVEQDQIWDDVAAEVERRVGETSGDGLID